MKWFPALFVFARVEKSTSCKWSAHSGPNPRPTSSSNLLSPNHDHLLGTYTRHGYIYMYIYAAGRISFMNEILRWPWNSALWLRQWPEKMGKFSQWNWRENIFPFGKFAHYGAQTHRNVSTFLLAGRFHSWKVRPTSWMVFPFFDFKDTTLLRNGVLIDFPSRIYVHFHIRLLRGRKICFSFLLSVIFEQIYCCFVWLLFKVEYICDFLFKL